MTQLRLRLVSAACLVVAVVLYLVVVANYTDEQGTGSWVGGVLVVALFALLLVGIVAEVLRWRRGKGRL